MSTADPQAAASPTGTSPVDDVVDQLTQLMSDSKRRFRELATRVHPTLQPGSLVLLLHLVRQGEQQQGSLAGTLHVDKAQVSRIVSHLVELGLVSRVPDPDDRRAALVAATDEAVRRIEHIGQPLLRRLQERLVTWQDEDVRALADLLRRLNDDRL